MGRNFKDRNFDIFPKRGCLIEVVYQFSTAIIFKIKMKFLLIQYKNIRTSQIPAVLIFSLPFPMQGIDRLAGIIHEIENDQHEIFCFHRSVPDLTESEDLAKCWPTRKKRKRG